MGRDGSGGCRRMELSIVQFNSIQFNDDRMGWDEN